MKLRLFGGLGLTGPDGAHLKFAARKSALLLAILALSGPKGMRRERLCGMLWEDRDEPQARASLRQALVELRKQIAAHGSYQVEITSDADVIALAMPAADIDTQNFDEALEAGALEEAALLYGGELLSGIETPGATTEWLMPIRQDYARKALRLVDTLSRKTDAKPSTIARCEGLADRLLSLDASAEEAHRALIRIYQSQGKTSAAARQLRLCTDALREALGVEPERETLVLLAPVSTQGLASSTTDRQPPSSAFRGCHAV